MPYSTKKRLIKRNVVILDTEDLSDALNIDGFVWVGIEMPAAWDAADLTIQTSSEEKEIHFKDLYDSAGNEITIAADVDRVIRLFPSDLTPVRWLKLRSGTSGSPVAQTGDRVIGILLRAFE
jgi:hypothetical protein